MRGLLRAVRELAKRSALGPYLGDFGPQGNNTYTKRIALDDADLASAAGALVARSGAAVHCHPQTFAGFRGEIYFGEDRAPADHLWHPLSRAQISTPPNGDSFQSFRVRARTGSNTEATNELVLVVDPAPYGSEALEAQPPTPEVNSGGGIFTRIRALLRSSGAEVDLEAADGSSATRGILGVAGLGTDGTLRGASSSAAAPGDAVAGAAGTLYAAALGYVYDAVGNSWNRARADVGAAGVSTLRVAGATTAGAVASRYTAVAASGEALAANARRCSAVLTNMADPTTDPTNGVYVAFGATAADAVSGYLIPPGQSLTITTVQAVNAIRQTADTALAIVEESK